MRWLKERNRSDGYLITKQDKISLILYKLVSTHGEVILSIEYAQYVYMEKSKSSNEPAHEIMVLIT